MDLIENQKDSMQSLVMYDWISFYILGAYQNIVAVRSSCLARRDKYNKYKYKYKYTHKYKYSSTELQSN